MYPSYGKSICQILSSSDLSAILFYKDASSELWHITVTLMLQILSINGPFRAIIVFSECSNLLFEDSISQGKESGPATRTGCHRNAKRALCRSVSFCLAHAMCPTRIASLLLLFFR